MANADGTIDVRVVVYVRVDPLAWAETMMDRPTTKTHAVRDSVKEHVRDLIIEDAAKASRNDERVDTPIGDVWLGVGQ